MFDLVCKLQKPNVALCHQMPFTTDQKGFAQSMEKVCWLFTEDIFSLQGPVVQSIVSLTSSLRGQLIKCFTTL